MSHPIVLLCRQKKGKLALCWLAATCSKQLFKKCYDAAAIKKLNIETTCDEILGRIQLHDDDTQKFNLRLSSQLMYGVTKIFAEQVELYEKELFHIFKTFNDYDGDNNNNNNNNNGDTIRANTNTNIELPELFDLQMNKDLHILSDELLYNKEMIMQDAECLNFGMLTDEELDFIFQMPDNTLGLKEMMQTTGDGIDITSVDVEIAKEIHQEMQSPRVNPSPVIVDASKIKYNKKLPSTPQKRESRRQSRIETPTKRRRISLEDIELPATDVPMDVNAFAPPIDVPVDQAQTLTLPAKDMEAMTFIQDANTNIDMELESLILDLDTFVIKKKPSQNKQIIDEKKILDNTVLRKWQEKTYFWTIPNRKLGKAHKIPCRDLLKQFSLRSNAKISRNLCKLFANNIKKPCKSASKDQENVTSVMQFPAQEEMRGLQKTIEDPTQMLSKLTEFEQPSTEQFSSVLMQAPCVIDERPLQEEQEMSKNVDADESLGEILDLLGKKQFPSATEHHISLSTTSSSNISQYIPLTRQEVLALLEVIWNDRPDMACAKFTDLIPIDKNSDQHPYKKEDAATVFCILLDLHAEKKVILSQKEFHSTLWIEKYPNFD